MKVVMVSQEALQALLDASQTALSNLASDSEGDLREAIDGMFIALYGPHLDDRPEVWDDDLEAAPDDGTIIALQTVMTTRRMPYKQKSKIEENGPDRWQVMDSQGRWETVPKLGGQWKVMPD